MYVDQALLPELVARRSQPPLTPYRRRTTIWRQSGGGPCTFGGHRPPSGRWRDSEGPPARRATTWRVLVRVLVAAHVCRRPQVLLYLAAVRDGPSPNGAVCPVWLTTIAITTSNVTMPAMTTTRTIHAPTPSSDGYGGGWAIANSYRRLHTWQVASLGLNSGLSR